MIVKWFAGANAEKNQSGRGASEPADEESDREACEFQFIYLFKFT